MTINPGGTTLHERVATSHEEVRGDQVGVDPLAFGLEMDPVVHEEFGPLSAGGMQASEHGVLRVPPQAHYPGLTVIDELQTNFAPKPRCETASCGYVRNNTQRSPNV